MVWGPVMVRQNDQGMLNLSGLDQFLSHIQAALPAHRKCMLFRDPIFCGQLQNITTYYQAIPPGVLTAAELKINSGFWSAWQPIKKIYGLTSCVQQICNTSHVYQLAKRHPYALEQLRVCHLLMNCYICFNGDQASGVNTFNCSPPKNSDYLHL